ncbi:hypothetical protein Ahy_B06g082312 isoform B [Arachis hypogaea]|uniref:Uncharacterized protein n=1 Tax=Arachis hypogaea TaxID=3818 RepID=A0A444YN72_ARAHY|nr:hypothetical protein Ahy_B06g082312 isoform A [Arachis hypogaea]RYR03394.1 hypothetical protein Ahy_B06g082312 isoform B [Arachis hypogaea]
MREREGSIAELVSVLPSPPPLKLCYGCCCRLSHRQGKPLPPLRRVESAVELCPVQFHRELPVTRARHYVPQLAELMLEFNKKEKLFNLKGIADVVFGLVKTKGVE